MYEAKTQAGDIKENPHKLSTSQVESQRSGELAIGPEH
jgi:hypothetical protein